MTNPRELVERLRERAEQIGMPGGLSHDLHVEAAAEITRLRGLLEEAREVLGSIASKNHPSTVKDGIKFTPDAPCLARLLLKRLEGE